MQGLYRVGDRQLFLAPGVILSVFLPGGTRRCRLRSVRELTEVAPLDPSVECLVEWLTADGRRTGALVYLPVDRLHPDIGPPICPLPPSERI
jgi:hypothetical protein